jgi:hypothetical protein
LPKDFSTHCEQRDYSQASKVTITAVVKGTESEIRITQEGILQHKKLVFSDPRDQAIAAALHACKNNGQLLFKQFWVRGSVPGFALYTDTFFGVRFSEQDVGCRFDVAASGYPSRN